MSSCCPKKKCNPCGCISLVSSLPSTLNPLPTLDSWESWNQKNCCCKTSYNVINNLSPGISFADTLNYNYSSLWNKNCKCGDSCKCNPCYCDKYDSFSNNYPLNLGTNKNYKCGDLCGCNPRYRENYTSTSYISPLRSSVRDNTCGCGPAVGSNIYSSSASYLNLLNQINNKYIGRKNSYRRYGANTMDYLNTQSYGNNKYIINKF